ncbi:MAG: leucine-rich repeat protein, partial [bacterium]
MATTRKLLSLLLIFALLALCGASAEVSIQLPAKLRVIGAESFAGLSGMAHVVLPEGVTEIHSRAFADTGLTGITLPSSLTY